MLCDKCHKNKAYHSVLEKTAYGTIKRDLCDKCVDELNLLEKNTEPVTLNDFFTNLFYADEKRKDTNQQTISEELICPKCQSTYNDFINSGKLGCSHCCKTFFSNLKPLLQQLHGSINHVGKIPPHTQNQMSLKQEISALKEQIQLYISTEEFEQAAIIRDRIKALENQLNNPDTKGGYLHE